MLFFSYSNFVFTFLFFLACLLKPQLHQKILCLLGRWQVDWLCTTLLTNTTSSSPTREDPGVESRKLYWLRWKNVVIVNWNPFIKSSYSRHALNLSGISYTNVINAIVSLNVDRYKHATYSVVLNPRGRNFEKRCV